MNFIKKTKFIGEILMSVAYATVGLFATEPKQQTADIDSTVDKSIAKAVTVKGKKEKDGSIGELEICLATPCKWVKICLPAVDNKVEGVHDIIPTEKSR